MSRLQSTAAQFDIAIKGTQEQIQRALVTTAKREHAKVMRTDPRPGAFRRYVDGVEGAQEDAVKFNGVIVYDYQRLDIVAQFAMETLFDRSPVLSGEYRNRHTLFLNGVAVRNLKAWRPGDEVSISNTVPWSRKIELGVMKMRVPGTDKVYFETMRIVNGRYGNLAKVTFTYRGIVGGGVVSGRAGNKADIRFPTLLIRER